MKYTKLMVVLLLMTNLTLKAQQQTINLWDGEVPNSIFCENYDLIVDTSGEWAFTRQITQPNIDVYLAPENKNTGTAVIICPGGGYWGLAFVHEGRNVAKWFNSLGISAFVLKYRLPDNAIMKDKTIGPLQDAQQAMRIVRSKAAEWKIDPEKIGIMGFSAGGHLASTLSTHYNQVVYEPKLKVSARPDFSLLIYPVISMDSATTHMGSRIGLLGEHPSKKTIDFYSNEQQVNKQTPPAFLIHSLNDDVVPVQNSINYAVAMKNNGNPCELHIYYSGGHGYGMGRSDKTESDWTKSCERWLESMGFIPKK